MASENSEYWDSVYRSKGDREVSWFEERPELSLSLIRQAGADRSASVIDIGGGASRLVDALVEDGQSHVAVLDLSATALARARERLSGPSVDWIVADVTEWVPARRYEVWHDRAAFHFLVQAEQQQAYVERLKLAVPSGGKIVIGTFAPDGPEKCSGLPVARHDSASLQSILGEGFTLISGRRYDHVTPWQSTQHFQFSTFHRN